MDSYNITQPWSVVSKDCSLIPTPLPTPPLFALSPLYVDALALAGIDYEVLGAKIISELESTPTLQGYNSGLSAAASEDEGLERVLSPDVASTSDLPQVPDVTIETFKEQLGLAGEQLLGQGLSGMTKDVETLLPFFATMATGTE
jgi:transaldolase